MGAVFDLHDDFVAAQYRDAADGLVEQRFRVGGNGLQGGIEGQPQIGTGEKEGVPAVSHHHRRHQLCGVDLTGKIVGFSGELIQRGIGTSQQRYLLAGDPGGVLVGEDAVLVLALQFDEAVGAVIGTDPEFAVLRQTVQLFIEGGVQGIVVIERGDDIAAVHAVGVRCQHTLGTAAQHGVLPVIDDVFFFMPGCQGNTS